MKKKYHPKYYPTRNESFDSDEIHHLITNIKNHGARQTLIRDVWMCISVAIVIVFLLTRCGGGM